MMSDLKLRRMLTIQQVLKIIPVSRTTIFHMERAGTFPRSHLLSPGRRVWFEDEILAWQNGLPPRPARSRSNVVSL